ncbi:MAG: hypothetical protein WBG58_11970 [Ignavibacteriaceae bacterium]
MKKIVKFTILGCLILIVCKEQTQLNKIESDLKSEYAAIDFFTPSGWSLTINQDGSGQVGFGSLATDFADFGKNTFNFSDVMQKLESKLESEGSISTKIAVNLWEVDEASIDAQYISDKTLVNMFFQKALSAITYNKERIEEIYKDKKPVSFE